MVDLEAEEQGLVLVGGGGGETYHERLVLGGVRGRVQPSEYDVNLAELGGVLEGVPQHFDIGAVADVIRRCCKNRHKRK